MKQTRGQRLWAVAALVLAVATLLVAALRVRIAPSHAGASPSALMPDKPWALLHGLARVAFHRAPPSR